MKIVIFDFDGTLINSSNLVLQAFQYAFKPFGIDANHDTIEKIRSRSTSELFDGFIEDDQKSEAFGRLEEISSKHSSMCVFFPGIPELIEDLKKLGHKLAIWTGRDTESSLEILDMNNYRDKFCTVVGNTSVSKNKPHPEGIFKISNELNIDVENMIMVGDHVHDIEGGKAAGVKTVLAKWGRPKECDRSYDADFVASDPSDVLEYVKEIWS